MYKQAFQELKAVGVSVRTFAASKKNLYIHAKVIIADEGYAFVGSQNFSYPSLEKNRELGIFLAVPSIVDSLEQTFNSDYSHARKF